MKKSNWKLGLVIVLLMICCVPTSVNAYSLDKDDYNWTEDGSSWIVKKCQYKSPKNSMTVYFKKSSNYTKGTIIKYNSGNVYIDSKDTSLVTDYWPEHSITVDHQFADQTKNYFSNRECPDHVFVNESDTIAIIDNETKLNEFKEMGRGGDIYYPSKSPEYISCKSCSEDKPKYSAELTNQSRNERTKIQFKMKPDTGEVIFLDNNKEYYDTDIKYREWFWDYGNSYNNSLRLSQNLFHYLYFNETAGSGFDNIYLFHWVGVNYHVTLTKDDPVTYGKSLDDEHLWTNYNSNIPVRNQCNEYSDKVQEKYNKMWAENKKALNRLRDEIKIYIPRSKTETIVKRIERFNDSLTTINKDYIPDSILKELKISSKCTMATDYAHLTSSSNKEREELITQIKNLMEDLKNTNSYKSLSEKDKKNVDKMLNNMMTGLDLIVNITDASWLLGEAGTINCEGAEEQALFKQIQHIFDMVKVIVPIILIVMGALDFGKAVLASDEKAVKQAQSRFIKRAIIAVCIFLLPTIIEIIFNMLNENSGTINVENPLCGIR